MRDVCSLSQAAQKFESKLKESVLEADGQLAFRKLADVTAETLMPKIETKGEFGQARWRLTSAPQIPNLLSLDPTTDPFKSLANLSFGAEVEIQIGKKLQVGLLPSEEPILAPVATHSYSIFVIASSRTSQMSEIYEICFLGAGLRGSAVEGKRDGDSVDTFVSAQLQVAPPILVHSLCYKPPLLRVLCSGPELEQAGLLQGSMGYAVGA